VPGLSISHRRIRLSGVISVIDGPFVETKEVVGGYALVEAKSFARAVVALEYGKRCSRRTQKDNDEITNRPCHTPRLRRSNGLRAKSLVRLPPRQ
jgi:hypothetical protein